MTAPITFREERISLVQLMHRKWRDVPLTAALVALNLLIFVCMAISGGDVLHLATGTSLDWGANFAPATEDGQWWRLFTAVFVHLSLIHVLVNLWALWDIGRLVEGLLGAWRYLTLFVGAGLVGNLLSLALQAHPRVSSGASGAIFGLYGALIVFLWQERARIALDEYRWISTVAVAFSVLMLVLGFFIPSIDNAAHGGGLLGGAVLAVLLGHPAAGPIALRRPRLLSPMGLLAALAFGAVWMGLSRPPYRYSEELSARTAIQQFVLEDRQITARWQALLSRDGAQSFEQAAAALNQQVAEPYQRSFEALAKLDSTSPLPSRAALLQMQSLAEQRRAQALESVRVLERAGQAQGTQK
jgi:rhomboid protease GluP